MVCLDSDVIIDFLRNEKYAVNKIIELKDLNLEISTTAVNAFELIKGAMRSSQKDSKEIMENFIANLNILEFNLESSRKAAEIFEELRQKGEIIDPLDLFIASIAIANKESLLTRNINHFKRIQELKIEPI